MNPTPGMDRRIGLLGATGIGVGGIVGGGILALAGVAFSTAGPSAIVAFALNGTIAVLTALSFAEMASKFPESGGTYTFSKKVLSVETAFMVGWVVWFASIVAAVLYAVGFAYFATLMTSDLLSAATGQSPEWLTSARFVSAVAVVTTVVLAIELMRRTADDGDWINTAKVIVFGALVLGGLWAVFRQPAESTQSALTPFFSGGMGGLIQAMGYSFIALQGFDLVAAVGGEVRDPAKTIPKAMLFSLAIALTIYLPLLFVIVAVGTPGGDIATAAANDPEGIVAIAARQFLGPFGYWLVIVAAVLSMFTAMRANVFAASRIALAMAKDRTLSSRLSVVDPKRGTPVAAIAVTASVIAIILLILPDVGAAGAASSLIFLITFALAHWISILVRQRSTQRPPPFLAPYFPLVQVVGGLSCIGLAMFQAIAVPKAGYITLGWLSIGGILFLTTFARRARVMDASSTGFNPELVTLRGRTPLVLVPVANPRNAEAMIHLADALVPADIGRVLMQTVVVAPHDWDAEADPTPIERSQAVHRELLRASAKSGIRVETLTTVASEPMEEIERVALLHRCESVLLGLSEIYESGHSTPLETLLSRLDANVVVLRSRPDWHLAQTERILIPIAGRADHQHLRALLLGRLLRGTTRHVTFVRVLPSGTHNDEVARVERALTKLAADEARYHYDVKVVRNDDPLAAITEFANNSDLMILGIQSKGPRQKLIGHFTRQIAQRTSCPIIVMSQGGDRTNAPAWIDRFRTQ